MAFQTSIVNVDITRNTTTGDRATFGIPLFVYNAGATAGAADVDFGSGVRTRIYTDLESMTDDGFAITDVPYVAASQFFAQNPNVQQIVIGQYYDADTSYVTAVTAIALENDDWYVLTAEIHTSAEVLALAAYIEARQKLYFVSTDVAASISTSYTLGTPAAAGDIAGLLSDLEYDRTAHIWHDAADTQWIECAFAGYNLPFDAGRATWTYLQLNGVAAAQNASSQGLTTTEQTNLANRRSNMVVVIRGVTVTREGKVVGGEWIDIIRGVDALDEEMTGNLFDLLVNQQGGKVPYTDAGLNLVRGKMADALTTFVGRDFILDDYTITIPAAADIPFADKSNRLLQNVQFEANLVGAIHTITIAGNVTYTG